MPLRRDLPVRQWLHLRAVLNEMTCRVRADAAPLQPIRLSATKRRRLAIRHTSDDDEQPHHPCRIQDFGQYDAGRLRLREAPGASRPARAAHPAVPRGASKAKNSASRPASMIAMHANWATCRPVQISLAAYAAKMAG
jgi:hypothetical protein